LLLPFDAQAHDAAAAAFAAVGHRLATQQMRQCHLWSRMCPWRLLVAAAAPVALHALLHYWRREAAAG
jgi:anti-sigma-K factor RskA